MEEVIKSDNLPEETNLTDTSEQQAVENVEQVAVTESCEQLQEQVVLEDEVKTDCVEEKKGQPEVVPEEVTRLISTIDGHFNIMKNLLKYNKDKDANVTKLTKELQDYREGVETSLFRSIALDLIGLREDWKKSAKQFSERKLSLNEAKKYLNYIIYDCEDLLLNLNIKVDGDNVIYNNKSINADCAKKPVTCEVEEFVLPEAPQLEKKDVDGIAEYLVKIENYVTEILKNNSILDKMLSLYMDNSNLYEEGVYQVMLYPVIRAIAGLHSRVMQAVDEGLEILTEENATETYCICVEKLVSALSTIISACGVSIEEYVSDTYNPQKHRILKTILTENAEDNGKVANVHTDCYAMDNRVIYPQKVDIYKLK